MLSLETLGAEVVIDASEAAFELFNLDEFLFLAPK